MRYLTERELELGNLIEEAGVDSEDEQVKEWVEELKRIRGEIDPWGCFT